MSADHDSDNELLRYFQHNEGPLLHKWLHYFDVYVRHLEPFRGRPVTMLEIGVFHGGSLAMWRDYLGPQARIVGVDVDPRCASLSGPQVDVRIGDQADPEFLARLRAELGGLDVVLDDGGHTMEQQIASFRGLWPAVRDGGVYLVEDTHTSYWPEYGGGHRRPGTFVEYAKTLIDTLHAWHSRETSLEVDDLTQELGGMHVYDSVVVLEKRSVQRPRHEMRGRPSFPLAAPTRDR